MWMLISATEMAAVEGVPQGGGMNEMLTPKGPGA